MADVKSSRVSNSFELSVWISFGIALLAFPGRWIGGKAGGELYVPGK